MTDVFSVRKRREIMRSIRGRDTEPELIVRSIVHRQGFRFRVNQRILPGNPDIVLKRHEKVIFVNGCFWHGHKRCLRAALPETNKSFWKKKIESNVQRDNKQIKRLRTLGWKSMVVWTCELRNKAKLTNRILRFLSAEGERR